MTEAELEKEAEEFADRTKIVDESTKVREDCISLVQDFEGNVIDIHKRIKTAYIAGYNKANEWHKQEVDDIYDFISKDWSARYFLCVMKDKSRVTAIGNCDEGCNGEVSVNLFFEYNDEKYYIDDIVWWKEIVLPEPPKESE